MQRKPSHLTNYLLGAIALALLVCCAISIPKSETTRAPSSTPNIQPTSRESSRATELALPAETLAPTETITPTATATIFATSTYFPTITGLPTIPVTRTSLPSSTHAPSTKTPIPTRASTWTPIPTRAATWTPIPTIRPSPTWTRVIVIAPTARPPARVCCKVCTSGKACGDSCIAKNKTCHQPPGCACDG